MQFYEKEKSMPKKKTSSASPRLKRNTMIIVAICALILIVLFVKKSQEKETPDLSKQTAEAQLDNHLEAGRPVFVFFHSNNCQSCIDMMGIVDQVYPEFEKQIALVDVNVYDEVNQALLQRAGINSIPTQVFINSEGQGKTIIGVMNPDQLREQLQGLQ
jgi:thiol-disulfide isomerase/thioredoxin